MPRPSWIFAHDCQEYAYKEYAQAADDVRHNRPYKSNNIPEEGVNHRTMDFRDDMVRDGTEKI